jgi:hypothetical protein
LYTTAAEVDNSLATKEITAMPATLAISVVIPALNEEVVDDDESPGAGSRSDRCGWWLV